MANSDDLAAKCKHIQENYAPCDVSDALLNLHVPVAGLLADIAPIPSRWGSTNRVVAPVSTILFVANEHKAGDEVKGLIVPKERNLPTDRHWSDVAAPGTVVIMQQPSGQIAALLGDIVATRFKIRGIRGIVVDGRARDVVGCGELCKDGTFQCWTKSLSSVGTSTEAKPWAVDVPLQIGKVTVKPGDIICADEAEMVVNVIPREKLDEVLELLPIQKKADDGLLRDVQNGMDFKTAVARHPDHYTVRHANMKS